MEEAKEREERLKLIESYTQGKAMSSGSDYDLHARVDRYGFITSDTAILSASPPSPKKDITEKDWLDLINNLEQVKSQKSTSVLIYTGMPQCLRGIGWSVFLRVPETMQVMHGVYKGLKRKFERQSTYQNVQQIDKDVKRCFRNHILFKENHSTKQRELFCILTAYSLYNPILGYTQGMDSLAALLLMFMNEEEAFWAFVNLMSNSKNQMNGFYVDGLPKAHLFMNHLDVVLRFLLPDVYKHMENTGITANLYSTKWFLNCYLTVLPFSLTLRIWDVFLLKGDTVLLGTAYTIIDYFKNKILKLNMTELLVFFTSNDIIEYFEKYSDDDFMSSLQDNIKLLVSHKLLSPAVEVSATLYGEKFATASKSKK